MSNRRRQQGKGALELIEEATHAVRTAPPSTWAAYFVGTGPFLLGLLFFWGEMSRSPLAPRHLAAESLGMALLFFWMKFWQVIFVRRIRAQIAAREALPLRFRDAVHIVLVNAFIQPAGLVILPLSMIPILAFPWAYAFYQSALVFDPAGRATPGGLAWQSFKHANRWTGQNFVILLIMAGFSFLVFLNWLMLCGLLPALCKMLLGVESEFTRSPYAMLNTTFFAALCALTYLSVDPILKTIYVLRCFYGESLTSGEDLKADLMPFLSGAKKGAGLVFVCVVLLTGHRAGADTDAAAPAPAPAQVVPADLDRAINETIHENKYIWRMPREKVVEAETKDGVITQFLSKVGTMIREAARDFWHWLRDLLRKLAKNRNPEASAGHGSGGNWVVGMQVFLYALVGVVAIALALLIFRLVRNRSRGPAIVKAEAMTSAPDVADENVRADELPEEGWLKMACELLERGEFRLAMRAFYLASLSHLASRNLVSIARYKSNRDYERELRRRAHALPGLFSGFGENIAVFEGIWYGTHAVDRDLVDRFAAEMEKLRMAT